jgi:hypothetical protein
MNLDDEQNGQDNPPGGTMGQGEGGDTPRTAPDDDAGVDWKQRARRAEREVESLRAEVERLTQLASSLQSRLEALERRRALERELGDAADLEAAVVLAEHAMAAMDPPDAARAARDIRRRMPFLFRAPSSVSAMAGRAPTPGPDELALQARESGDRRTLMKYLRARRGF